MKPIYLDHAATTPVAPAVKQEMEKYFSEIYGNPGSLHAMGKEAQQAVEHAREKIATFLHAKAAEIVFTGSGTESCNLAILGVARAYKDKGNHIITAKTEHHAVLNACAALKKEGFEITYMPVDKYGSVQPKAIEKAITNKTILVTIMYANNEMGTINPIKEIGAICRKKHVLFHTDACQAAAYLGCNVENVNVDLLSLNGSKMYGPKGIGALYIKQSTRLKPILFGGGQEQGLRPGTENVPYIVGLAKALEIVQAEHKAESVRLLNLRNKLSKGILESIPNTKLNGHPTERLPNNVNIAFKGKEGDALVLQLSEQGIYAATGAACESRTLKPSHVLIAIGLTKEQALSSIRFSLGKETTKEAIGQTLKVLKSILSGQ